MRRTLLAVVLAVLLTLSGCSALGIGDSGTPTPAPTSGDAPSIDAPGVEDGQLSNRTALLDAHGTALLETGFVTDIRVNATASRQTDTGTEVVSVVRRQETRVSPDAASYGATLENQGTGVTADEWGNRSVRATRLQVGNRTRYRAARPLSPGQLTGEAVLGTYLTDDFSVESVEETDGRTLATLTSTTAPAQGAVPRNATDVRNYEARLVVDGEGRIHSLTVTVDYTLDGEPGTLAIDYELTRTGVDPVDRPDWVSEALAS